MKPKEVIKEWVEFFNKADLEGLISLYDEKAINHQVVTEPLVGIEAIKKMFEIEFARAEMVCQIENIFKDGEWVILEWSDPLGLRGCGFFHVQNSKIIFQRGYFDQLTFFKIHGLEMPDQYLGT